MFRRKQSPATPTYKGFEPDSDSGETWEQEIERRFHALEVHIQELATRLNDVHS
jgi:hypothetical protein